MSWYSGSQNTDVLSAPRRKPALISRALWNRLPCVTMTPLGVLVDPDVYCKNASRSGVTPGSQYGPTEATSGGSVGSQRRACSSGASANEWARDARTASLQRTTLARESEMTARRRSRLRFRWGGYAGT